MVRSVCGREVERVVTLTDGGMNETYLVELLMKQDRMSMAASIESRVPFLDHPFVEFAASVPDGLKLRGGKGVATGLGTADIAADAGSSLPTLLARVFNDAGVLGTSGLTEEIITADVALQTGDSGVLFAPADVQKFRLNVGIRTLSAGASMNVTVRDKDGVTVKTTSHSYAPTFFTQPTSSTFLDGYSLTGGETITIELTAGGAILYGSTTDNTTNDPSVQFVRK